MKSVLDFPAILDAIAPTDVFYGMRAGVSKQIIGSKIVPNLLTLTATATVDLSAYVGDLVIFYNDPTEADSTLNFTNYLPSGRKVTILNNLPTGYFLTLTGTITGTIISAKWMDFFSTGTAMIMQGVPTLYNTSIFTASGNFTVPSYVNKVWVTLLGGGGQGGNGGGSYVGVSAGGGGGGGGGGQILLKQLQIVTPNDVIAVTVGGSSQDSTFQSLTAHQGYPGSVGGISPGSPTPGSGGDGRGWNNDYSGYRQGGVGGAPGVAGTNGENHRVLLYWDEDGATGGGGGSGGSASYDSKPGGDGGNFGNAYNGGVGGQNGTGTTAGGGAGGGGAGWYGDGGEGGSGVNSDGSGGSTPGSGAANSGAGGGGGGGACAGDYAGINKGLGGSGIVLVHWFG